ncbi:MAG TPA: HepT-like ribonuclease domain-containing protein [Desulfatiglandales bacterium]|nr:HepT-like ribonuclease domain-containing protein [Desulfatiglandales bacterium]
MPEFRYARGRIIESIQFISEEIREFEEEYSRKTWKEYQEDRKLQKLMDRTVENVLTALVEICGTFLTEKEIAVESYGDALKKCAQVLGFSEGEQEDFFKLAVQRNRMAHRYLNFRWQAIKAFHERKGLVIRIITTLLEREKEEK